MKTRYFFSIIVLFFVTSTLLASFYNVKDFGAKGDGKTLDSPAINDAIEKAASAGGGRLAGGVTAWEMGCDGDDGLYGRLHGFLQG